MGRPRLRTPALRQRFIEVAVAAVEAGEVTDLTTRQLAQEAGSSLAALNELFGGKQGLVDAAALTGFASLADTLDGLAAGDDARSDLLALCRAHRRFTTEHPGLSQLMFSRPFDRFEPTTTDTENANRVHRHFTSRVAALLGAGRSSRVVIDAAIGLVALLHGLDHQHRSGTLGSTTQTAERRWTAAIETHISGAIARSPSTSADSD